MNPSLEMVRPHKETVATEHEADVREERSSLRRRQEYPFEQLMDAALVGAVGGAVVAGGIMINHDLVFSDQPAFRC
jgi:hypothetical protein